VNEGVNIPPRGQISPLGARGEVKNGPLILVKMVFVSPVVNGDKSANLSGANPTIGSYSASAVKIYNASSRLVCFENNIFEIRSTLLQS
jgi:hypothetical protein